MNFQFFRRFFYETHLWLGIVSGLVLFVVCLSGTILVFQDEVRHLAEPEKYYVKAPEGKTALSADALIAKVEAAKPGLKVASITIPEKANRTVSMSLTSAEQGGERGASGPPRGENRERAERGPGNRGERPQRGERGPRPEGERGPRPERGTPGREGNPDSRAETAAAGQGSRPGAPPQRSGGHGRGRNTVYVDPYTAEIVGEGANKVDPFFMSTMRLHRFLWMTTTIKLSSDPSARPVNVGKLIVGVATIVFVVICLTGLVLWLPRTWSSFKKWRAWKPGFRIRLRKGFWPFLYDTHNTIGFYLLIPALILALTGLCWSFSWYRDGASQLLGDQIFKQRMQRPEKIQPVEEPEKPLSVDEMIARQNKLTPGSGEMSISIPQDRETAMVIQKGGTGFFSLAIKDKTQWDRFRGTVIPVEQYGKTIEVERFADKPLGAKIAASVRAIHFGNITGMSSKIFFFVVCLFATSWPLTGVVLWVKKLHTKRKKAKAAAEAVARSGTVSAISHHEPADKQATSVGQPS